MPLMLAHRPRPETTITTRAAAPQLGHSPPATDLESVVELVRAVIRKELVAFHADVFAPEFVDKHTSGLGPSVFLAAARAGEFDTFRVGKRFVARASDVRAYIERQRVPRARAFEPKVDEFDVQLLPRVRRTRQGPTIASTARPERQDEAARTAGSRRAR